MKEVNRMGTKERKAREKREMRELILKTALNQILEKGIDKVTIRSIAKEIEYSVGAIYLYFRDKNAILFALQQEGFRKLIKKQKKISQTKDPLERLKQHAMLYLDFAVKNSEFYKLMFIMEDMVDRTKDEAKIPEAGESYRLILENIRLCKESGYFKGKSLETVSFAMWAYVHGVASLIIQNQTKPVTDKKPEDLMKDSVEFLISNFK